jgi:predicted DNA-binding transcriptional regulator AlpA
MSTPKILRYPAVVEMTGLHRSKIEEMVPKGEFPKGVKLTSGGRAVGFFSDEIELYLEWRRAERDGLTKETWKQWFEKRGRKVTA